MISIHTVLQNICKHKMNDGELSWTYIVLDNGSKRLRTTGLGFQAAA